MSDAPQPGDSHAPPEHLDYEVLRLIGQGGYGEVWLVRNREGNFNACKIIRRESFEDARPYEREFNGIKKFEPVSRANESQLNILHVGRRDEEGYFYYIMELADDIATGQQINPEQYVPKSLGSELKRRGRIPPGECVRTGLSLSAALENLHEHGLIHRDIKPANIIFVNGIPKLADIGLVTGRNTTVSYVGTEGYIPAEGPGSPQSDVYGLGKMLYEMATGKDRLEYPQLPTDLGFATDKTILLELNAVINRACAEDVNKRYRTAGELHADLTLLSGGKSVRQKRTQDRRKRAAVAVIVGIAFFLMAFESYWFLLRKPPQQAGEIPTAGAKLTTDEPAVHSRRSDTELARVCVRNGFEAYGANDYRRASELSRTALAAAQDTREVYLLDEAGFLQTEIARCEAEYKNVAEQFGILAKSPNDAAANTGAGQFLCLLKNDWQTGLPMLAQGANPGLKAAANAELRGIDEISIGDLWWQAAEGNSGPIKAALERRARNWYRKAVAKSSDVNTGQIKERLASGESPFASIRISAHVGSAQRIEFYADELRWNSDGYCADPRINQLLIGDLRGKDSRVFKNTEATRLYSEGIDFSTAQLKIERKPKKRGKIEMQIFPDHVILNLIDNPKGTSAMDVTVSFGRRP